MTKDGSVTPAGGPAPPVGPAFSIGKAARRSGVKVETIRFYERSGLVAAPPRTAGGHRVYDAPAVRRLAFLRRARELGCTLGQVRDLLALAAKPDTSRAESSCTEVAALATIQLDSVRGRLADLARMETVLAAMIERCAHGTVPDCPILEALFEAEGV